MKVLEGAPMIRLMLAVAVFVACADTASAGLRVARWRARPSPGGCFGERNEGWRVVGGVGHECVSFI